MNLTAVEEVQETWVQSQGGEDPLEEEMATHSRILSSKVPGTEGPGGLQSVMFQRVVHDWACIGQCSVLLSIWYYFKRKKSDR